MAQRRGVADDGWTQMQGIQRRTLMVTLSWEAWVEASPTEELENRWSLAKLVASSCSKDGDASASGDTAAGGV